MKRTLVNSLGKSFESRTINAGTKNEQKFLWKHNFKNIDIQKVKSEKKVFKVNARKSKAAHVNMNVWKQTTLKATKMRNTFNRNVEAILISKGLLVIDIQNDEPIKNIVHPDASKMIAESAKAYEELIISVKEKQDEITTLKLESKKEMASSKILEVKNLFAARKATDAKIILRAKALVEKDIKTNKINKTLVKTANKDIRQISKSARPAVKSFVAMEKNKINKNEHLTAYDKLILCVGTTARKYKKSDTLVSVLSKNADLSYDIQLKRDNALVSQKDNKALMVKKLEFAKELNELIKEKKKEKTNVEFIKEQKRAFKLVSKNIRKEWRDNWASKKNELKAGSASRRARGVALKTNQNNLSAHLREAKLNNSSLFEISNKISKKRKEIREQLKFDGKLIENKYKDNLVNTPVEVPTWKYWTSIILGCLFPGLDALINKQWIKGLIQIVMTSFVILLLSYAFGAFKSGSGQGIVGLSSLGHDPKTATDGLIGVTNGVNNDGRFYLVMGVVGIIFLAIGIMYWIISVLNNINQNNLARIGVRYSNWRQQKHILKNAGLPYLISIPAMLFILFIVVLPLLATILISFTDFGQKTWNVEEQLHVTANGVATPIKWVGSDQFDLIFKVMGPEFKDVFIWTIIWTFGSTITLLVLGTVMAIIVNQNRIIGKSFFRVIYLLPWAVPAFITIMFFSIFFAHDGKFNALMGITTDWAEAGSKTKFLMIMMQGWLGHSYIFLLITGMLQSIPKSLYEAARIDGSSSVRQFRTITLPIVMSQIAPLIIGQFTFNFNNFGLIYLFNEGGLVQTGHTAGEQDIFISWIYKLINSGTDARPGAAAAMSLVISVFTVTPSAFMFARSNSFRKADF